MKNKDNHDDDEIEEEIFEKKDHNGMEQLNKDKEKLMRQYEQEKEEKDKQIADLEAKLKKIEQELTKSIT